MPFPDIDPVLVHIGPLAIRWYGLAYMVGILFGWRYTVSLATNPRLLGGPPPVSVRQIDDLVLWVALGIVVGGRLGSVLLYEPSLIWRDPLEILQIWHGGMSFHGGLLGVIVAVFWFARRNHIDLVRLGDLIAPCAPIGILLVRGANFINGELWGRPTSVPWGVVFPNAGPEPRHPSQLYEMALEGLALFLILRWATHGPKLLRRRGLVVGLFLLLYAVFRILAETVREPDPPKLPYGLTMGMVYSLPMLIAGIVFIARALSAPDARDESASGDAKAGPAATLDDARCESV